MKSAFALVFALTAVTLMLGAPQLALADLVVPTTPPPTPHTTSPSPSPSPSVTTSVTPSVTSSSSASVQSDGNSSTTLIVAGIIVAAVAAVAAVALLRISRRRQAPGTPDEAPASGNAGAATPEPSAPADDQAST
jgi:hypothetical protein